MTVFTACAWVNEECVSFAIVSDYMHHDKHMTIISLVKILKVLLERFPTIGEINLFSDGAAQHFKQRFFLNSVTLLPEFLEVHRDTLKIDYNFFATSHGKGAVDGVGGSVKRQVLSEVMSKRVVIKTSVDYAATAQKVCNKINIIHIKKEAVEAEKIKQDEGCFNKSVRTLPGIRRYHHLAVTSANHVEARLYKGCSGSAVKHRF